MAADELGLYRVAQLHEALPFELGGIAMLTIVTEEGQSYEANFVIEKGLSLIHVPSIFGAKVDKLEDVGIGELAGTVIDEHGTPLMGITVNEG